MWSMQSQFEAQSAGTWPVKTLGCISFLVIAGGGGGGAGVAGGSGGAWPDPIGGPGGNGLTSNITNNSTIE